MSEKNYSQQRSILGQLWFQRELAYTPYGEDLMSQLLAQRNITEEEKDSFLTPTLRYFLPERVNLKDLEQGGCAIVDAVCNKKKIVIWGDYDVDGATSTALLVRFFRFLGHEVGFYIPDREKEGYGPNKDGMRTLHAQGVELVITVDCGAVAFEPLAYAKKIGLDIIVVDHHAGGEINPECVAHINPNRKDEKSDFVYLAAVGVTFLLCIEIVRCLRKIDYFQEKQEPNLLSLLDIVALGTVCDVVPLIGLNRAFVKQGLKVMSQTQNTGIKYLLQLLEVDLSEINAYHLGFVIGPRINAGGRIGCSRLGTELLSSDDVNAVQKVAAELNLLNEERRQIQSVTFESADSKVKSNEMSIVVCDTEWHHGVIGIVAGKLKDKYHKPTFVIAMDSESREGKASARSISGFDIGQCIHAAHQAGVILQGGGHPMAGGFSLTAEQVPKFEAFINTYIREKLSLEEMISKRIFDHSLNLSGVSEELVDTLERLAPFGSSNPTPKITLRNVCLAKSVVLKEKHIKCFLKDQVSKSSVEGMVFNAFDSEIGAFLLKMQGKHIDVLAGVKRDVWMGRAKLVLYIDDVRESI